MSMEMNKALDLLREIRPSIPKEVLELWCKDRDAFLASHPAVEQAGGDERVIGWRERILAAHPNSDPGFWPDALLVEHMAAEIADLRAALAQPSPASVCATPAGENCPGDGVKSCKKCPEQPEAERPEVVGYRSKESGMVYEQDYGLKNPEALTTVAECERIVGALRADRDSWAEQADQRLADWDEMRKERDAALARVEELERQEPVALANRGLHAFWVKWTEAAAGLYGPGIKLYAAPVAQAQHSVPEGWMLVECGIWTQEQVDEMQKTVARFRNSEFVDDRALAMAVADAGQCKAPQISLAELLAAAQAQGGE